MGQDRFISRTILVLAALGCSGLLSACPYTDRHVNLAPPTMVPQIFASPGSNGKGVISVARPLDLRPDPTVVGNVRDGYGRVGAQVRSNNDVPLWVTNSFITGLEQAGYRVERVETAETAQTPVAIDVTVSRVFVDYTPGLLGMSGGQGISPHRWRCTSKGEEYCGASTSESTKALICSLLPQLVSIKAYSMER
jgi:hypothetical protein